jgi:alkanesulfonate monooxygenase SsuD/methylene tetrahydromethanopterin reductase-like flavin-dependent oxidoreductase (luciferase family)
MEFGIQFFPDVGPAQKSAEIYWQECLHLTGLCDELGLTHVRTVEHYFHAYGGYSTNPLIFLAAASQRTQKARLITGAILPVFNHPLKVAGEIGMMDAISGGRLEVGFARAFLPHEFRRFGRSMDESRARFDEGMEQIRRLLEEEHVTMRGQFHSFEDVTSLPRPVQKPRPPFWIAASSTPASYEIAGRLGHWLMTIPRTPQQIGEWMGIYRDAWRKAGHPGHGRVMIAFHMFCAPTHEEAVAKAREHVNAYYHTLADAAADWGAGARSKDYPNHPQMIEGLRNTSFEKQVENGAAFVGSPDEVIEQITRFDEAVGGFEDASLQVNFNTIDARTAEASTRLFAEKVMPHIDKAAVKAAAH